MSTRAQIAIQIGPDEWAHVYVHFDGYTAHMLPALERWKPEDILLDRLKSLSDDHFETHPDEIDWGHVGTLNHYASLLRQITDSAFKEGKHAA